MNDRYDKEIRHEFISDDGIKFIIERAFGGLHWYYENKHGECLSIICHSGSYGHEHGLFEVYSSWKSFNGDSVKGWLSFAQVQHYINELIKRNKIDIKEMKK